MSDLTRNASLCAQATRLVFAWQRVTFECALMVVWRWSWPQPAPHVFLTGSTIVIWDTQPHKMRPFTKPCGLCRPIEVYILLRLNLSTKLYFPHVICYFDSYMLQENGPTQVFLIKNNLVLIKTPITYIARNNIFFHIMWHCNIQYNFSLRILSMIFSFYKKTFFDKKKVLQDTKT